MPATYTPALLERIAARFRILGDATRLGILNALREGERTVGALVEVAETSQANVSKHLALLHRERLVARRKEGLNVYYRISDPGLFDLCEKVCDALEDQAERARAEVVGGRPDARESGRSRRRGSRG